MHMQPIYADAPFYGAKCSEDLFNRGLCLPSSSILSDGEVYEVIAALKSSLGLLNVDLG